MGENRINVFPLFSAQVVPAGHSVTSDPVNLSNILAVGQLGIQLGVTGDGIITVSYLLSINGADFIPADGTGVDVLTEFTKTGGPDSDGKFMYPLGPMVAPEIKIKITETGGADPATVSLWLAVQ